MEEAKLNHENQWFIKPSLKPTLLIYVFHPRLFQFAPGLSEMVPEFHLDGLASAEMWIVSSNKLFCAVFAPAC